MAFVGLTSQKGKGKGATSPCYSALKQNGFSSCSHKLSQQRT